MLTEVLRALAELAGFVLMLAVSIRHLILLRQHRQLRANLQEQSDFLKERAAAARDVSMEAEKGGNKAKEKRFLGEFMAFHDAHLELEHILHGPPPAVPRLPAAGKAPPRAV